MHSTREAMHPHIPLCRPSPKLDESWGGYLIRLSYENRFNGLLSLAELLAGFRKEFSQQFQSFVRPDHTIDWQAIIRKING